MKRINISMNYDWFFISDFKVNYLDDSYDFYSLDKISIPHTMKELPYSYFNEKSNQFIGTYFKELVIEESSLKSICFLKFMGVMNKATIYINNKRVFIHQGGYVPFEIILNDYIKVGKNIIKVIVDGFESKDVPPFGNLVDYLPYSGIYREVFFVEKPSTHIEKVHLFADDINVLDQTSMLLNVMVKTNNELLNHKIQIEVLDHLKLLKEELISKENYDEGIFSISVENIQRWDINSPKLYDIKISLYEEDTLIDSITERFGFRTVMFTESGFLLNNEKVKLVGLNRHQSYPYIGYAAPKSMQEMDADILKSLGCNIVRTSHYMQSDHFINRCDEIGLLVFEEIPGWNYIGDQTFKDLSLYNLEVMINHHFNHPSICLWGVRINESADDNEFYEKTNALAKAIDPSRQTGGVRNIKKSNLLEDVYTYNDFSHTGDNDGLEARKMVTKVKCPYLVTEYNGHVFPTKKTDSQKRRT